MTQRDMTVHGDRNGRLCAQLSETNSLCDRVEMRGPPAVHARPACRGAS